MNAFAAAIDLLFEDPNMAVDALYRAGGEGSGTPVRVIRKAPDQLANFGDSRFVTDTLTLDLRVAEVSSLAKGDTIEIAGELFEVRSEPIRDRERLVWSTEGRPL
ncbi:head-tail joining protein [Pseudorhodobacter sp.]|uniref:head-tail joining protein n=1 Tax=Pseudorhodobacter sp. TaxID=1934400 RepID=UPI002AFFD73B|nr:hypothetical protein [Pseudorhodobacter sp.]